MKATSKDLTKGASFLGGHTRAFLPPCVTTLDCRANIEFEGREELIVFGANAWVGPRRCSGGTEANEEAAQNRRMKSADIGVLEELSVSKVLRGELRLMVVTEGQIQ